MSIVASVEKLHPGRGDVIVVDIAEPASDEELRPLAAELGTIAHNTGATVLLLPDGVELESIDEREMLARGWMRVSPIAHTTAQLAQFADQPSPQPDLDSPTTVADRR